MLIEINTKLTQNEKYLQYIKGKQEGFIDGNSVPNSKTVRNNIPGDYSLLHNNYLQYLEYCWGSHYQVVLTPDIIWYTLLCELALIVKEKPQAYRDLFTVSPEKLEVSVPSDDLEVLPLDTIAKYLKELVPHGFAETFLPTFSTSTERSSFAHQAAFADTVSPYYSYSMFMCGLSAVHLEGTPNDWTKVLEGWQVITAQLSEFDRNCIPYYNKVINILAKIPEGEASFFKDMFRAEKCGSGSETELYGWFTELYRVQPDKLRKIDNFSTHVSVVEYKHLQTKKNYVMKVGCFASKLAGIRLEPEFSYIVYEKQGNE